MDMDKSPLNRAHQLERKSEILNRQKKLDECIQCHTEAVELYTKCLELGDNKNALESVQLQKEWNERQIRMLQLKKSYLERTEREKKLNRITASKHSQKEVVENLEARIFRNFETHDSLICYLAHRGIVNPDERHCHSTIEETEEKDEAPYLVGNKHPKDDSTIIEELKELSGQLRESVQGNLDRVSLRLPGLLIQLEDRKKQTEQIKEYVKNLDLHKSYKEGLLIQLDDRNREIEQLKTHIKDLELEKSDNKEERPRENLKATNESSGATSPLTVSSITDLDLDVTELKTLPQLETVAVPDIDISAFKQFQIPEVSRKLLRKDE